MNFRNFTPLLFHVLIGVLVKFTPAVFVLYYLTVIGWATWKILSTNDQGHCAAKFGLYAMGLEILYRIGGFLISWELGKYACSWIFLCGLFSSAKRSRPLPFLCYLLLLLPAIVLVPTDGGVNEWRKQIAFVMSGQVCLVCSGMYFMRRGIPEHQLWNILRLAILPGVSLLVVLFLGRSVGSVEFSSNANFSLSGGFGPNQVSTALGYFLLLLVFATWNQKVLTLSRWMDYALAALFAFRGLLTFSRGGPVAFVIAVLLTVLGLYFTNHSFRARIGKTLWAMILLVVILGVSFLVANRMTDNWISNRFAGKTTNEVVKGIEIDDKSLLTGRDDIAVQEWRIFNEHWLTGAGVGMSEVLRGKNSEMKAAHSEPTRLLAEHGLLGAVALFLSLIFFPFNHFILRQSVLSRQFFLLFFVLGFMNTLHSAMRLALPGVLIGFSFALILPSYSRKSALAREGEKKNLQFRTVQDGGAGQ